MKIRAGMISNSSSSSFVIYGFKVSTDKLADILGVNEDGLWDRLDGLLDGDGVGYLTDDAPHIFLGKVLIDAEIGDGLDDEEMDLAELQAGAKRVQDVLGIIGEPKFYMGVRAS